MTDAANEAPPAATGSASRLSFGSLAKRLDLLLPVLVLIVLAVMLIPLPTTMLDFMLGLSFAASAVILMIPLFMKRTLEFTTFPTVLLLVTMLRLALNIASTRLILTNGHLGPSSAGHVIEAFGQFLMGGNFVVGLIIFIILMVINFVVITKGSSRIAEVAARFTLDALPGKQMAIDADLSSGLIDEAEARKRREKLQEESGFFGSMDGAAKFVRGDATAGLIITAINLIGGMIIGMVQHDITFSEATTTYTLLTVGDGLVTQIPALFVSLASGFMVTKGSIVEETDTAMTRQFTSYPSALTVAGLTTAAIGLLPGMPFLFFGGIGAVLGYFGFALNRRTDRAEVEEQEKQAAAATAPLPPAEEPISSALTIDDIRLELGYGLLPLISDQQSHQLTDQIKALRRQLATELGFVMPSVRILDNMQLPANMYVIRIKEVEAGKGDLRPGMLLVMDPRGMPVSLPGQETREPTFGLPATWVEEGHREEAMFRGYTVVDPATVVTTHLTELVKDHMSELMSYSETQKLLDDLPKHHMKLITDIVPSQITTSGIQRVMQNLLNERISIRDLPQILEGISEAVGYTRNITMITEHVRARLNRQISNANTNDQGFIPLVTLSPEWEQNFANALVGQGEDRQLSMAPSQLQDFISRVRSVFESMAREGELPVLLTSPGIRPYVRSIIERFRPSTIVLSQNEIHPKAKIRTLGQI